MRVGSSNLQVQLEPSVGGSSDGLNNRMGCYTYGQWHEMGIVREGVFTLAWSASPRARSGMRRGDAEIRLRDLRFPDAGKGFRCFARVMSPTSIELLSAPSRDALDRGEHGLSQLLALDAAG